MWITPSSDRYDTERIGYQQHEPHRPDLIAPASTAEEVRDAVAYAAERSLPIAVQASGHGHAHSLDGGVLISTHRMSGVRVDPVARTAWVEAGATWQQVIDAAAPHGLAPLSGSSPGVGAVSYTLGGGIGLLARKYGHAADRVRRLQVVTADGTLADAGPDLFWGLRGGGGALGIVTGMEISLVPVTSLYGGGLYLPASPDVLAGWADWTSTVPAEMTSALAMLVFPDVDGVPEPLRGRHIVQLQLAYAGPAADGAALIRPLHDLGPVLLDSVRETPYTESATIFDEPDRPHAYRSANRLLSGLDPAALTAVTELAGPSAPTMCVVQLRHLGGAPASPPAAPSAISHRSAAYSLNVLSPVAPAVPALHAAAVAPFADRAVGRLLNFSYGPLSPAEVREAYDPETYDRLLALRDQYDPKHLLRPNHPLT